MAKVLKAGVDAGNNSLKLAVQDQEPMIIPTSYYLYVGESSDQFTSEQEDIPPKELIDNIDVTITSAAISTNGMRHIVGRKILTDNLKSTELEKQSDKSTDDIPVIVALSGLAVSAMKQQPDKDTLRVNYDIGLALPIATITPEAAARQAERFTGTHTVVYHHPSGRSVTVHIMIEYAKCLPEGAAAAWGIVYNQKGELAKRKVEVGNQVASRTMEDKTLLVYDIGAGTTEKVVLHGVKFLPKQSSGLNYGSKETLMEVQAIWNHQNPRNTIDTMVEFEDIFFDSEHPRHNSLVQLAKPALLQLSNQLSTDIINKIDDMKDDPFVFVIGGGAAVLKDTLHATLNKKGRTTNVTFVQRPLFANATGLLVYALSPRFQALKDKDLGVAANAEKAK
ncbi:ParM/StbA family protein [Shouchella shacheensis]|uniref:ParM/StbA family protein n=1 Tax=Shouchella shacheensis TaxID=1649580 RepID=UPI00074054E5|nr:ParM/StbA family protein [Shouchella shacheensis]